MFLCSSGVGIGASVLYQATLNTVLLWSDCSLEFVCLSVVAVGALVVFVVAVDIFVLAYGRC